MAVTVRELADAAVAIRLIEPQGLDAVRGWERLPLPDFVAAVTAAGRFPASALYRALAERRGLPFVECEAADLALDDARRLPDVLLRRGVAIPVRDADQLLLVTADPDDRATLATAQRLMGREVPPAVGEPAALRAAAVRTLAALGRALPEELEFRAEDAVTLLDGILKEAYLRRATDVHLEPQEEGLRVRLRIDGALHELARRLRPAEAAGLLSRVKVLADLDIAEQRAPQDGGFTYRLPFADAPAIDIRAATLPTRLGERATLRILGAAVADLTLAALGMSEEDLAAFRDATRRPHGLVLLCGPTGCGKTTTLYAALREINAPDRNVLTVEDPIEYKIAGVSQVQVSQEKVTFAAAIRSLLRHDPDVMMVGEIRDAETADVALRAALTGHLVFATLHTNHAVGALTRLLDLGCEPYRIAGTLVAAVAQRLVRRVCPRCAEARAATPDEECILGGPAEVAEPRGCALCLGTGFAGRIGIFESLWVDGELARCIARGAPEAELAALAGAKLRTLREDGIGKVRAGITTAGEVMRAVLLED